MLPIFVLQISFVPHSLPLAVHVVGVLGGGAEQRPVPVSHVPPPHWLSSVHEQRPVPVSHVNPPHWLSSVHAGPHWGEGCASVRQMLGYVPVAVQSLSSVHAFITHMPD